MNALIHWQVAAAEAREAARLGGERSLPSFSRGSLLPTPRKGNPAPPSPRRRRVPATPAAGC